MKRPKWYLVLLLVGILLLAGCGPGLLKQLEIQAEDLQEQVDALEARVSALEFVPFVPPIEPVEPIGYSDISIPIGEFQNQPHIDVVMSPVLGAELTVTLGSNPTTGYMWLEEAKVSDESIVRQSGHRFEGPGTGMVGAPGEETWVFKALKRGTTTILLEYCRGWETPRTPDADEEGGRGTSLWTVTITATIR